MLYTEKISSTNKENLGLQMQFKEENICVMIEGMLENLNKDMFCG